MKPKAIGVTDKCFCGTQVVCQEQDYQGTKTLSWRNTSDSKAHYQILKDDNGNNITDGNGKNQFECRKDGGATEPKTEQSTITFEDDDAIVKKTLEIYGREQRIRYALKKQTGKEPSNEHVGLYLKLVE